MTNEYGRLIQRVRRVNRKAAIFLARQFPLLGGRGVLSTLTSPELSGRPDGAFLFSESPQGIDYWVGVFKQLEAER